MRNVVTNTSALPPDRLLLKAMVLGASASIEAMEAEGQQELLQSDVMPARCQDFSFLGDIDHAQQRDELLKTLGFTLAGSVMGDPLFILASLPDGWRKVGSEHAMWSYIHDERGRRRISLFYKAAPYDRKAHFVVEEWVHVNTYHGPHANDVVVLGGGQVLRTFGTRDNRTSEAARAWAESKFPDHDDPLAYWNLAQEDIASLIGGDHAQ